MAEDLWYARKKDGKSDVGVFFGAGSRALVCRMCSMLAWVTEGSDLMAKSYRTKTRTKMITHLETHRMLGAVVPAEAISRLFDEVRYDGDFII